MISAINRMLIFITVFSLPFTASAENLCAWYKSEALATLLSENYDAEFELNSIANTPLKCRMNLSDGKRRTNRSISCSATMDTEDAARSFVEVSAICLSDAGFKEYQRSDALMSFHVKMMKDASDEQTKRGRFVSVSMSKLTNWIGFHYVDQEWKTNNR